MAIRTFRTSIDDTAYTKVGSNTTIFSVQEHLVGNVRVVVTDVADPAPALSETQYIFFDESYVRNSDAVDIWMYSPEGQTFIEGESQ